jgi:hypothetical protein
MDSNINSYVVHDGKTLISRVIQRVVLSKRKEIFAKFKSLIDFSTLSNVLDVGVSANKERLGSNFFELFYPYKEHITVLSDQDASWMTDVYPGLKFVRGDGRDLPFDDKTFDLVFSSAVIEHVGSFENQQKFLSECCRVSKKYVFMTTPNKWHPIEFHTAVPFLHWFPKATHRKILKSFGGRYESFANEDVLNLLDRDDINLMFSKISNIDSYAINNVRLFAFVSNLLIFINIKQC